MYLMILIIPLLGIAKTVKTSSRKMASNACSTQNCQNMTLDLHNLEKAKKAYLDKAPSPKLPTMKMPPPTKEEKIWDLQMGRISNFVCNYSFDRALAEEKDVFINYVAGSFKLMTRSLYKSELAECFMDIWLSHKTEVKALIKKSPQALTFQDIQHEGQPAKSP